MCKQTPGKEVCICLQVTVYLDIVFLLNYVAELFVLVITAMLLRQDMHYKRICFGALVGSVLLLPCILRPKLLMGITGVLLCTGISMATVAVSLGTKHGFIKKWFVSNAVMVLLGGMMNYLKYTFGVTAMTMCRWALLFFVCCLAAYMLSFICARCIHSRKHIYQVYLRHAGTSLLTDIYLDTGNRLWDALFGKPVILLSEHLVWQLLSSEEKKLAQEYKRSGYIDYSNQGICNIQQNICFHEVAYQSVGNPSGKLLCFLLEEMELPERGKVWKKQPVAIADAALFFGREYKGLLFSEGL